MAFLFQQLVDILGIGSNMKVSIVIPVYNQLRLTIGCLKDVIKTVGVEKEIIVVDDGSTEPVYTAIQKMFPDVMVLKNKVNLGFAHTVNRGICAATGDYVCLLNNDVVLKNPSWLKIMLESMNKYGLYMTAPAGGRMTPNYEYIPGEAKKRGDKFTYLVGWCLLVRKEVFQKIGFIPEIYGKGFFEDVHFGVLAKRAGFKMDITEGTGVEHLYHQTFKSEGYDLNKEYKEKRKIFLKAINNG